MNVLLEYLLVLLEYFDSLSKRPYLILNQLLLILAFQLPFAPSIFSVPIHFTA